MALDFYKMHGLGNDFILFDAREKAPGIDRNDIRHLCDRKRGVGADGVILMEQGEESPLRMIMFNPDGSRAEMCGNGIRCLARLWVDKEGVEREQFSIETDAGVKDIRIFRDPEQDTVTGVQVNMGAPHLEREQIPMKGPSGYVRDESFEIGDRVFTINGVSMGNPHIVIFRDALDEEEVTTWGPRLEKDDRFPERTNVEFVRVDDQDEVRQKTWERGAGLTEACGTGACAVAVSSLFTDRVQNPVTVKLDGGDLEIDWKGEGHSVYMTGPAAYAFRGEWPVEKL